MDKAANNPIEQLIQPRARDLGDFEVRRVLPAAQRRLVGPFIFFDHMGPVRFSPGKGISVRPHPHICLATVTYLFEGEIFHRDSLGYAQPIQPGDVNWMTAGRGIVHSERTAPEQLGQERALHGIQSWVALPKAHEEAEPSFFHHPKESLPELSRDGATLRLIAGSAYGETAPVKTFSDMFYVDAKMAAGSSIAVPDEYEERAVYVADGAVTLGDQLLETGTMAVLAANASVNVSADEDARVMLLGGEPMDGDRHIWWNYVASSKERIEQAKADWKEGRFPKVPGDEEEFIPLPEN